MAKRSWFGARRPASGSVAPELVRAGAAFGETLDAVERAKAALVTAVRSGRAPGAPLAEALAGFETALAEADASMAAWHVVDVDDVWVACRAGLDDARRRAEQFRLSDHPPEIYEHLIAAFEDLMDPLDPFERAASAFRAVGVRV